MLGRIPSDPTPEPLPPDGSSRGRIALQADAHWIEGGWSTNIDSAREPITAQSLSDLRRLLRATIAAEQHVPSARVDVHLTAQLPAEQAQMWGHSQHQDQAARRAAADAAATRRTVIRHLTTHGISGPDIATLLNLSPGRIYQLQKDTTPDNPA